MNKDNMRVLQSCKYLNSIKYHYYFFILFIYHHVLCYPPHGLLSILLISLYCSSIEGCA